MASRPDVLFGHQSLADFRRGFMEMAELAAITYGPRAGLVVHQGNDISTDGSALTGAALLWGRTELLNEVGQAVKSFQANPDGAASRMGIDERLGRVEPEAVVNGRLNEPLHLVHGDDGGIDVNLEVVALPGGIDAYGDRRLAKGPFQHRFGQVNQSQAPEEIGTAPGAQR